MKVALIAASLLIPLIFNGAYAVTVDVSIVTGSAFPDNGKFYDPPSITVKPGTTVVWTNHDTASHTVTSGTPTGEDSGKLFESGLFSPGKTFSYEFTEEGTVDYWCMIHPWMIGRVIVTSEPTSSSVLKNTAGGRFSVELLQSPPIIEAGTSAKFAISFFNPSTQLTETNIVYDFIVVKEDQSIVERRQAQALSGITIVEVKFPKDQSGTFEVRIDNVHYATEPPDPTEDDVSFTIDVIPVEEPQPQGEPLPPMMQRTLAGNFDVEIVFSPTVIEPNKPQSFALSFFDPDNGFPVRGVQYDFAIVKDGKDLINKKGQDASQGTSVQQFTFTEEQTGSVTVRIDNVRLISEPVISGDETAFSVTVVPEFPVGIMLVAISAIAMTIVIGRFKRLPYH